MAYDHQLLMIFILVTTIIILNFHLVVATKIKLNSTTTIKTPGSPITRRSRMTTPDLGDSDWPVALLIGVIVACLVALVLIYLVMKWAPKKPTRHKVRHKQEREKRRAAKAEASEQKKTLEAVMAVVQKAEAKKTSGEPLKTHEGEAETDALARKSTSSASQRVDSKEPLPPPGPCSNLKFNSVPLIVPKESKSAFSQYTQSSMK